MKVDKHGGVFVEIEWNIKPLEARDVHHLFNGLELFLNTTVRAFALPSSGWSPEADGMDNLLEIEVVQLGLGSLRGTLELGWDKVKEVAKHPVGSGLVVQAVVYAISTLSHLAHPSAPPASAALSPQAIYEIEEHGRIFLESLSDSGKESHFTLRETSNQTSVSIHLPIPRAES